MSITYTDRKIKITPKAVAEHKEDLLNEISQALYASGDINQEYIFTIEYDSTKWAKYERAILDPNKPIVRGVLQVVSFNPIADDYLSYVEYYTLTLISTYNNRDDLDIIFREYGAFLADESKTFTITTDSKSYTVNIAPDGYVLPNKEDAKDGSGKDKAYYFLADHWVVSSYIYNSSNITLTIDNSTIPFVGISHDIVKPTLASASKSNTGFSLDTNSYPRNILDVHLNLTDDETIKNIFIDSRDVKLINKLYQVKLQIGDIVIIEEPMELALSNFNNVKPETISFGVTFTTQRPTQLVFLKADSDVSYSQLRVAEFNYNRQIHGIDEPDILNDDSTKRLPTHYSYQIELVVPYIEGDNLIDMLEAEVLGSSVSPYYDIMLERKGATYTYNTILINGTYSFTEAGEKALLLTFIERRD